MNPVKTIEQNGWITWRLPNGKLHRLNGPAVIRSNGHQEWWLNGQLHRENGPAIIESNGHQEWWLNGLHHRKGGHAHSE